MRKRQVVALVALGALVSGGSATAEDRLSTVTVTYSWLDGSVPERARSLLINHDTGESYGMEHTNGVAEIDLAPGDYGVVHTMFTRSAGWTVVGTVQDLTVTEAPAKITVNGRKAKPVTVTVDHHDAEPISTELRFFSERPAGAEGIGSTFGLGGQATMYAIPTTKPTGHTAGFTLRSELASPADAADPTSYSLFHAVDKGIPANPRFVVHDKKLAVRNASYHSLGGSEVTLERENRSTHSHYPAVRGYLPSRPVPVPSTRTEYYTADPEVSWSHLGIFSGTNKEGPTDYVLHNSGVMTVGAEDEPWLSAPLSVRMADTRFPAFNLGLARWPGQPGEDTQRLLAWPLLFSSGTADEAIQSSALPGTAVISKDGVELATGFDGSSVVAELPAGDSGSYTVTIDATRDVAWTPLGTRSTAMWTFDSAPVTDDTMLDVSTVRFNATGILDGYADITRPQQVTLDYETQQDAPDRQCQDMTFEVSYDDGQTWTNVDIDRGGDHATATLNHPAGAQFVSVKFTAVDDKGQTVQTSTIRSYGLT